MTVRENLIPQNHSISTSLSLLERLREANEAAWTRLCLLYSPLIYSWIRRSGYRDHDAADIAQEVFTSISMAIGDFRLDRQHSTFRGWLWTITRNKVRDHIRKQQREVGVGGSQVAWLEASANQQESEVSEERAILARRALEIMATDFEEKTWSAFLKTAVEGQSAAQVAGELGMTVGAVYVAKSRVLHRLRTELGGTLPS